MPARISTASLRQTRTASSDPSCPPWSALKMSTINGGHYQPRTRAVRAVTTDAYPISVHLPAIALIGARWVPIRQELQLACRYGSSLVGRGGVLNFGSTAPSHMYFLM